MSWFLAFVGFSTLIILHELGHFAAAKWTGMRVEGFSLFFGPVLAGKKVGDTLYAIRAIPLGGYVKISGMNPREELPPEVAPRAYYLQPVWKRLVVIGAGPFMSLLTAFVLLWGVLAINGTFEPTNRVAQIERGGPASGVLQPGDELLAVDGVRGDLERFRDQIASHRCAGTPTDGCAARTPAELTILRDGRQMTVSVTPRYDAEIDPPRARVGFAYDTERVREGVVGAAGQSVDTMWFVTSETVSALVQIFTSAEKREELSGPVGSYEATRQSFELSTAQAIYLLAVISLSLGIVNLFPFLPLDGGHIFWAVAEKIRGRAIPFAALERASVIGFALVMVIFFIGLTNDIGRLTGEGINVR
jgi:regulator of sigma E protease